MFLLQIVKKLLKAYSALQQSIYIEETFSENPDIEAVGERHLV